MTRRARLAVSQLEDRTVPANIRITGVEFLDGSDTVVAKPVLGSQFKVRATWEATDLTAANSYRVRISVNDIPLQNPVSGAAGNGVPLTLTRSGWYAAGGTNVVTAVVDADGQVAESDEGDNTLTASFAAAAPAGLPATRFVWPMGGVNGRDYSVVNYNDVDPRQGAANAVDFRGGQFTYDGHNAFDVSLPNFARMDAGVPVLAAAAGTVVEVRDDQFDRDVNDNPGHPENYIKIDHGNGWSTEYLHISKYTAAVRVGDAVAAGQPIALVGSSGISTDAHLHFTVLYRNLSVETMYAPAAYLADAPAYQADQTPSVTDAGVTNASSSSLVLKERPDEVTVFPTSGTADAWFWAELSHVVGGETYRSRWYRPDGTVAATFADTPAETTAFYRYQWPLPAATISAQAGTWHVALERDGVELVRRGFVVTDGAGSPEVRLTQGTAFIISGRTTPIAFPAASPGNPTDLTFTLANTGTFALTTAGLQLPPGFVLNGSFPASVPAGGTATFTLRLQGSTGAGTKFGEVSFLTNDADESQFRFNITGTVTGTPAAGSPVLTDGGAFAALARVGFGEVPVAPDLTVTDPNSANFGGGSVLFGYASGSQPGDALSIRDEGAGAGKISHDGPTITYGGVAIGEIGPGAGGVAVSLNAAATRDAVQALLRNVTFTTTSTSTAPRYVFLRLTDDTGLNSARVFRTVVSTPTADVVSIAAVVPTPTAVPVGSLDVTFAGPLDVSTFTAADLTLTRDGGPNLITGGVTVTPVGGGVYRIGNLAGLTGAPGTYTLTVDSLHVRTVSGVPGTTDGTTTWTKLAVRPTVTIARAASQPATTTAGPVRFLVTFSESVTGFAAADIAFTGTLGGLSATVTPNGAGGASYLVDVSGMTGTGTVGISVADGAASSAFGGLSVGAATPADQLVTFTTDPLPPPPPPPPPATTSPLLVGYPEYAVGLDRGSAPTVRLYNADGTVRLSPAAFDASVTGGVRVASADFNGDGVADLVAGTGPGGPTKVVVLDGSTGAVIFSVAPFEAAFVGGVYVAAGDVTGDGLADLVVTPDEGGGPRVMVYRGGDLTKVADFFGIDDPNFRGGARATIGDVTGDGFGEVVISAGFGGGPRVSAYDGKELTAGRMAHPFADFFLFEEALRNGAFVAAGDVDGDGFADVVGGGGPGGGPRVFALGGKQLMGGTQTVLANFFGGDTNSRGGIRVGVKDLDGDARADVVVGAGSDAGSRVTGYLGKDLAGGGAPEAFGFDALAGFAGGVFVG